MIYLHKDDVSRHGVEKLGNQTVLDFTNKILPDRIHWSTGGSIRLRLGERPQLVPCEMDDLFPHSLVSYI